MQATRRNAQRNPAEQRHILRPLMKELNWVPVPVHCRVMSQIWNCHTSGVSGISGRGIVVRGMTRHEVVVVGVFVVVPERTRDV
jgi:hypothetical protein